MRGAPRTAKPEKVPAGPLWSTVTPGRSASASRTNGRPSASSSAAGHDRDGGAGGLGGRGRAVGRDDDVRQDDGLGRRRGGGGEKGEAAARGACDQVSVRVPSGPGRRCASPLRRDRTSAHPARRLGECRGRSPGSRVWAVAPRLPGRIQWHREARARRLQLRGQPRRWDEPAPRSLLIPSVGAGTLTRRAFDPPPPPVKPPRVARGRSPEAGSAGRRSSPAGGSGASASRRWQHCARAARRRRAGVGVARREGRSAPRR